jgi:hypothetical protein
VDFWIATLSQICPCLSEDFDSDLVEENETFGGPGPESRYLS